MFLKEIRRQIQMPVCPRQCPSPLDAPAAPSQTALHHPVPVEEPEVHAAVARFRQLRIRIRLVLRSSVHDGPVVVLEKVFGLLNQRKRRSLCAL